MRKAMYILASIVIGVVVFTLLYMQWSHYTFVDRSIRADTGIDRYEIVSKGHSAFDWYANMRIGEGDATRLLDRYPFSQGFSKAVLVRELANPYVSDCSTCWYYLDDKGHGPYDYRLFILSGDKKQLTMYELFGN